MKHNSTDSVPGWRREIWNAAIEAAALIVEPVPHIDEERTCGEVASEIRKLKMADTSGVAPTDCIWPIKPLKQVQVTLPDGTSAVATPERAYFDAWAVQELENKLKSTASVTRTEDETGGQQK